MAPFWMLTHSLFFKMGFWYQGIAIDFMERDRCVCRLVDDRPVMWEYTDGVDL
jgi:hypothetical protein